MPEEVFLKNLLAVVGEEDVVLGFSALGFKVYAVGDPQAFKITLEEIIQDKTAICLVQDEIYRAQADYMSNYKHLPFPIFIPFSKTAKTDLLAELIKEIRLKATGAF
jgi:vacuolar-type H+-ATPase subunit F/Vma7